MLLVRNKTRTILPKIGYEKIADFALGKKYELSLVFAGETLMKKLNKTWKGKDHPTNILSFPLSDDAGEIFICPKKAEKEAEATETTFRNYIGMLFVHGITHLKGFDHGSKMEEEEEKLREKFLH